MSLKIILMSNLCDLVRQGQTWHFHSFEVQLIFHIQIISPLLSGKKRLDLSMNSSFDIVSRQYLQTVFLSSGCAYNSIPRDKVFSSTRAISLEIIPICYKMEYFRIYSQIAFSRNLRGQFRDLGHKILIQGTREPQIVIFDFQNKR